jgi:hypothetical protein
LCCCINGVSEVDVFMSVDKCYAEFPKPAH